MGRPLTTNAMGKDPMARPLTTNPMAYESPTTNP